MIWDEAEEQRRLIERCDLADLLVGEVIDMPTADIFQREREQLARYAETIGETSVALKEFAADHGPLGDPDLREACLRALLAGEVALGAAILAQQACDLVPQPTSS